MLGQSIPGTKLSGPQGGAQTVHSDSTPKSQEKTCQLQPLPVQGERQPESGATLLRGVRP